jgi:hypothetical protein
MGPEGKIGRSLGGNSDSSTKSTEKKTSNSEVKDWGFTRFWVSHEEKNLQVRKISLVSNSVLVRPLYQEMGWQ